MPAPRALPLRRFRLAVALVGLALALPGPATAVPRRDRPVRPFSIQILSSAADQVSGGDALVRVGFPSADIPANVTLLRNGQDVTGALAPAPEGGALVGVVDGFVLGENLLQLKPSPNATAVLAQLVVENHPESGPVFSGPQQQPFVCTTARSGLGQPIIDNQDSIGIRVAQEDANGNYPRDSRGYPTAAA